MTSSELTPLNITAQDFLRSLSFNAVRAAMEIHGHAMMTASDAKRANLIFQLLHLDEHPVEQIAEGQVAAAQQPKVDPRLSDIEKRMQELLLIEQGSASVES